MDKRVEIARQMARDPIYFGQTCFPDMFKVASPDFHYEITQAFLNLDHDALNFIAPRGHAKSSLVGGDFPLWHIFLEDYYRYLTGRLLDPSMEAQFVAWEAGTIKQMPHSEKMVILVGKAQGEAILKLQTLKSILGDNIMGTRPAPIFRALFGDYSQDTAQQWTNAEVTLRDGTFLQAMGTNQQARGKKKVHLRPTLVLVDDPEDEENTATAERMMGNMRWLVSAIMPSVEPNVGRVVVIGTPINEACMVVTLSNSPRWKTMWFENDLASGELLWPWYITQERLQREYDDAKSRGKISYYYREWEAKVMGDEDQIFRYEYLRWWTGELKYDALKQPYLHMTGWATTNSAGKVTLNTYEQPRHVPVTLQFGVDPASSTSQRADYTVVMVVAMDEELNRYVVDMWRRRERPSRVSEKIFNMNKHYHPDKVSVESIGYQEMLRDDLRRRCEEAGIHIPGLEVKHTTRTSKSDRIEGMEPEFQSRKVYLHLNEVSPEGTPSSNFDPFVDELVLYPLSKHDDTLDAYWYARRRPLRPYHEVVHDVEKQKSQINYYDWMVV